MLDDTPSDPSPNRTYALRSVIGQSRRMFLRLFMLFGVALLWLVGGPVRFGEALNELGAAPRPVRVLVLLVPYPSGAQHPSTIGAPTHWVTALWVRRLAQTARTS
jgi:hypothetical protein